MRAWQVRQPGPMEAGPLEQVTTEVPRPGPSELLVAVRACGVCRTDLHVTEGDLPVHREHVTPGHEVVGEVVEVRSRRPATVQRGGPGWHRLAAPHLRGVQVLPSRQREPVPTSRYTGWDADGGYAEFATVPAAFAHHLPSGYTDSELAPLLCAGIIGYRSLLRAELPPGGRLGLYGFGGSAHITAQVALAQGAEVHVMTRGARGARAGPRAWAPHRLKAPPIRRRCRWTPRSCSRRSVTWCYPHSKRWIAAAPWRSPESTSPTSRR